MNYKRSLSELEAYAVKWWPDELKKTAAKASIIPTLIETQDDFLSILTISGKSPTQIFDVIKASKLPANLILKHLVILSDFGGERLKRLSSEFHNVFYSDPKSDSYSMNYIFNEEVQTYHFKTLPNGKKLSNPSLHIDGKGLLNELPLTDLHRDAIMILLHGSTCVDSEGGGLEKCELGTMLGKKQILEEYIKERYIVVSRITGGAGSNAQGQIAEKIVVQFLRDRLSQDYKIGRGAVKLKGYPKASGMPFDIIVERGGNKVGIEISFQVTTNSVIERKAGLAEDRLRYMNGENHFITYILDGAGNFERKSAAARICEFSDCTVAFSDEEFEVLATFIESSI